jgi:predicted esterase YcpF (UPF0227 family)
MTPTKSYINSRTHKVRTCLYVIKDFITRFYPNKENTLVFLESGDEVLNYIQTCSYFMGSTIDITFGGSHSYESLNKNLKKIGKFLEIL